MYGGRMERTNAGGTAVQPPLLKAWEYGAGAGFSCYSAAIVDSTVVVGTLQGEVHFIDVGTGHGLGSHDFGSAIVGTPVVDKQFIFVALAHDEESLVAYNVTLGDIEWKAKIGDIESSPLLVDDRLYVASVNGKLFCLNKVTGQTIWTFAIAPSRQMSAIHSSPASDGNAVFFGCDNGDLYAVGLEDGKLRWRGRTGGSIMASPSLSGGTVYVGSLDRAVHAFDAATGRQLWKRSLGANIFSSQAVDDRHVYIGTAGRTLYCLNKDDGSIVWTFTAKGGFSASPLLSGDVLYAGCLDRTLYAFNAYTGEVLWQFKSTGRIKSTPVAWKQRLVVLAEDDNVMAFKPEAAP
jgi:outer membrane protein assembly factor BamB